MEQYVNEFFKKSRIERNETSESVLSFLLSAKAVNQMIVVTELGLPALCGVLKELDELCNNSDFSLGDYTTRQNIGRFIKYVMKLHGYIPVERGLNEKCYIPACFGATPFSTGAVYERGCRSKLELKIEIVEL